jgi:hypothetical protein
MGNFTRLKEEKQQYSIYLHISTNVKGKDGTFQTDCTKRQNSFQASMGTLEIIMKVFVSVYHKRNP